MFSFLIEFDKCRNQDVKLDEMTKTEHPASFQYQPTTFLTFSISDAAIETHTPTVKDHIQRDLKGKY